MKIKIVKIEKMFVQVQNEDVLDILFYIMNGEEVVATKRENFPLDTSKEVIEETLKKHADTFESDAKIAADSAEREKANAVADETIAALQDKEI